MTASSHSLAGGPPASKFTTLDGKKVHYQQAGGGETTLVCVHGWASGVTVWRDQVPAFRDKMRVLLVDLPGHGESEEPEGPYSMELFARAVAAVMDDAGVKKAVLMGHSNGTPVIRQFWRRFPERTQALIVVDGPLRQVTSAQAAKPFLEQFRGPEYRSAVANMADGISGVSDALKARIKEMMLRVSQSAIVGGIEAALDPGIWTDDPINVPTLCVMTQSPQWTDEYAAAVRKLVPDLDYRVIEGANHFFHMAEPDRFNTIVLEFLARKGFVASASAD